MEIYKQNLAYLEMYAPKLAYMLREGKKIFPIHVDRLPNEFNFQIKYNDFCDTLHPVGDKEIEIKSIFVDVAINSEILILFGLGCGYSLNYIRNHFKKLKRLVIIEPLLDIFQAFLEEKNFAQSFSQLGSVTFIVNQDEISCGDLLCDLLYENIKTKEKVVFVSTPSYELFLGNYFEKTKYFFIQEFRLRQMNEATMAYATTVFLSNEIANLTIRHFLSHQVMTLFDHKPVVIVSAGPSLNKCISLLPKLKKKAILVAVGSAITILDKYGIEPHFRVSIDYSAANAENIMNEELSGREKIPLFYANQVTKNILSKYDGPKILMVLNTDVMGQYILNKMAISYNTVISGPSVANIIFNYLYMTKCNKIIFLGQDMCFYDNKLHADKAITMNLNEVSEDSRVKTKDMYGQEVWSLPNYIGIKKFFENCIRYFRQNHLEKELINASDSGLGIEGVNNIPLEELLRNDLQTDLNLDLTEYFAQEEMLELPQKNQVGKEMLQAIHEEAEKCLEKIKDNIKFLRKIRNRKIKKKQSKRLWQDIAALERKEKRLLGDPFYVSIVQRGLSGILAQIDKHYLIEDEDEIKVIQSKLDSFSSRYNRMEGYIDEILSSLHQHGDL